MAFRKSYPRKIPCMVQGGGGLLAPQGLIQARCVRNIDINHHFLTFQMMTSNKMIVEEKTLSKL